VNSTSIIVAYKDTTASPGVTYFSTTTKSASTSTAGTPATLVSDVTSTSSVTGLTYVPIGVWASNYTYGIATSLVTVPTNGSTTYSIENFLNGTTTGSDSGLTNNTSTSLAATKLVGWPLTTGYTLLGEYAGTPLDSSVLESTARGELYESLSSPTITSYLGSFYANGTANTTIAVSTLTSSLAGPFNVFPDINGTMWIGWTDLNETESNVYNVYMARLQQQIYTSTSSENALKTLSAFVVFCLVSVFAF
jgi:hypothetical protein